MTLTVAFYQDQLCVRGTSVAMYDYARYNEEILGNKSIIIIPENGLVRCDPLGLVRFLTRFRVVTFLPGQLDDVLREEKCDVLYAIKYGKNDGIVSTRVKTVIHCVFDMSEPHGNVYAGVSKQIAEKFGRDIYVPHMIGLRPDEHKDTLREKYRIPSDAIVFGRMGGMDTFDLPFNWSVIEKVVKTRENIYFLFVNTPINLSHPRVIQIDKITDERDKNRFFRTCDAVIEAGSMGHSFGIFLGEASVHNKPIIAYNSPFLWNRAHLDIIGDRGIFFTDENIFYIALAEFDRKKYEGIDLNCYREYSPEKVMEKFREVFLS